jgi:glycosyltransferase involved in cell wall biosynthesis
MRSFPNVPRLNYPATQNPLTKPSLLLISATYVVEENRKKLAALAEHFDLTCITCARAQGFGLENKLQDQPQPGNYRLVGLQPRGNPGSSTRYVLRGLRKAIRDSRADIILVESEPWALIRWQAWLWQRIHQPLALFGEYSWENFERTGWRGAILAWMYRAANTTAHFSIAGNAGGAAIFRRHGRDPQSLLCSQQMGVDTDSFRRFGDDERRRLRDKAGIHSIRFVIGYAGRLTEFKGVLDLLVAAERLRARLGDCLEVHFLGGGDLRAALLARSGSEDWIRVHAPVPHAEVAGFLNLLDLFVHASKPSLDSRSRLLFLEQSPYALAQAMSCGIPSVGGAVGAIPAMIGVPEMLVAPGDVNALERLIEDLMKDGARRERVAVQQRAWVERNFTNKVIAGRWAAFLLSKIGERRTFAT